MWVSIHTYVVITSVYKGCRNYQYAFWSQHFIKQLLKKLHNELLWSYIEFINETWFWQNSVLIANFPLFLSANEPQIQALANTHLIMIFIPLYFKGYRTDNPFFKALRSRDLNFFVARGESELLGSYFQILFRSLL